MRIPARVATVAAAAGLALTAVTAPANAGPPNDGTYHGRCFLVATNDTTQLSNPPNVWTGYVGAYAAVYAPTLGHNPASGQVDCTVLVNGGPAFLANGSGTGAVAFAQPAAFVANPNDFISLCTSVAVTDAHGGVQSYSSCQPMVHLWAEWPGPSVLAALAAICAALNDWTICDIVRANELRVLVIT